MLNCVISDFSCVLKAAVPYAGRELKLVASGLYCDRNLCCNSRRKANGSRRPSSEGATTRYVRAAWLVVDSSELFDGLFGESAM